tara:strand:+ start:141400 stop:142440 length:1041 start_codon:yes stop_codon:yes gene_type:complete
MRDIAQQAGVAVTTVSSALHNTGRVSPDLKQRIHDIASQMGYRPKLAARLLRASKTGRLALIMIVGANKGATVISQSGSHGPIIAEFVSACSRMKVGFEIEYLESGKDQVAPECFTGGQADGALICGQVNSPKLAKWFKDNAKQYPCVYLDHVGEYNVWNNTGLGIYNAVQHLAALGHRQFAYLGVDSNYPVHRSGIDEFKRAVADFQLDDQQGQWIKLISKQSGHNREQWIDEQLVNAQSLLTGQNRPTAVIGQGVPDARCMVYAAMEKGLSVPRDLSIITYGMAADAMKSPPCLHCVEPDFSTMVQSALNMLRARLAGEAVAEKSVMVLPQLVERRSVAAVCED